jgi:hypothetical protein
MIAALSLEALFWARQNELKNIRILTKQEAKNCVFMLYDL